MKKNLGFSSSIIAAALALTGGCVGPNPDYIGPGQIVDGAPTTTTDTDAGTNPDVDGGNTSPDLGTPCPAVGSPVIGYSVGNAYAVSSCRLVAGPLAGSPGKAPSLVWYKLDTNTQLIYQDSESMANTGWSWDGGMFVTMSSLVWVKVVGLTTVRSDFQSKPPTFDGFCSFLIKGGAVYQRCEKVQTFTLWTP
jgi:hypothetical protein